MLLSSLAFQSPMIGRQRSCSEVAEGPYLNFQRSQMSCVVCGSRMSANSTVHPLAFGLFPKNSGSLEVPYARPCCYGVGNQDLMPTVTFFRGQPFPPEFGAAHRSKTFPSASLKLSE